MAVIESKRSLRPTQPKPQHAPRRPDPLRKTRLFDVLHNLNRGYGTVLVNLNNLELMNNLAKPGIFPLEALRKIRNRTEELRALSNQELLQVLAGREERDALRFGRLRARQEKLLTRVRSRQ
jgi:hypothetical protein